MPLYQTTAKQETDTSLDDHRSTKSSLHSQNMLVRKLKKNGSCLWSFCKLLLKERSLPWNILNSKRIKIESRRYCSGEDIENKAVNTQKLLDYKSSFLMETRVYEWNGRLYSKVIHWIIEIWIWKLQIHGRDLDFNRNLQGINLSNFEGQYEYSVAI